MTREELAECISECGKEIYSFCRWLTGSGPGPGETTDMSGRTAVYPLKSMCPERSAFICRNIRRISRDAILFWRAEVKKIGEIGLKKLP